MKSADILNLRELLDMTEHEFARFLNVNVRSVRRWEKNDAAPAGTTLVVLRGLREAIDSSDDSADAVIESLQRMNAVGGLSYVLVRCLRQKT